MSWMFRTHNLPEHQYKANLMSPHIMRIAAKYVFHDWTAYNNSEQRSHGICQCDRVSLRVGIYDARRKEGDGEYGTDDATDDLALSAESAINTFERGGRRTLFLRRKTSGSQEY